MCVPMTEGDVSRLLTVPVHLCYWLSSQEHFHLCRILTRAAGYFVLPHRQGRVADYSGVSDIVFPNI